MLLAEGTAPAEKFTKSHAAKTLRLEAGVRWGGCGRGQSQKQEAL